MSSNTKQTQPQVNRAQPSTACRPCRQRRAKCDRVKPSCSQCVRSSRECSGYRDSFDLVLRDRTRKVTQKYGNLSFSRSRSAQEVRNACGEEIASSCSGSPASSCGGPNHDGTELLSLSRKSSPLRSLSPSMETVSAAAFTQAFDGIVYLDYIPGLLASNDWSNGLQQCFEAVSLIYFSQSYPNLNLQPKAREAFSDAVQHVNQALTVDCASNSDSILASVMLLALYSMFSTTAPQPLSEWNMHFEGAIALLCKRSTKSYSGRHAQLVLTHILSFGAMHAFKSKQRMPPRLLKLFQHSVQMGQPVQIDFWDIIGAITDLQHLIDDGKCHALNIIIEAYRIDQRLEMLYNTIMNASEQEDIRASYGLSGEYPLSRQFQSLNTLRVGRMRLNDIMFSHANLCLDLNSYSSGWDVNRLTTLAISAVQTADLMAEQIHDTIPEAFRPFCRNPRYPSNSTAWICSFVWPLNEILSSTAVSKEWLELTVGQLELFAKISDNSVISNMALESACGNDHYQRYVPPLVYSFD